MLRVAIHLVSELQLRSRSAHAPERDPNQKGAMGECLSARNQLSHGQSRSARSSGTGSRPYPRLTRSIGAGSRRGGRVVYLPTCCPMIYFSCRERCYIVRSRRLLVGCRFRPSRLRNLFLDGQARREAFDGRSGGTGFHGLGRAANLGPGRRGVGVGEPNRHGCTGPTLNALFRFAQQAGKDVRSLIRESPTALPRWRMPRLRFPAVISVL